MLRDIEKKDGEDDRYVRSRAEDRSPLLALAYTFEKYRPLIWMLVAIGVAIGFDFKTPAQKFREVQAHGDSATVVLQAQINAIKVRQDASLNDRIDQRKMLEFTVRFICSSLSEKDISRLSGTESCEAAAHPLAHAAQAQIRAPGEPP